MNASKDQNSISTLLGTLNTDGVTLVRIQADPTTHALQCEAGGGGTDLGPTNAPRDENNVPALMAISSADGVTPVVVYADAGGHLLVSK